MRPLTLVLTTALVPGLAAADEVLLRNGDRFSGQVISLNTNECILQIPLVGRLQLGRSNVVSVVMADPGGPSLTGPALVPADQLQQTTGKGSGSAGASARESADSSEPAATAPKPIGQKQAEEEFQHLFLRQSAVLLKPGQVELESGFSYENTEVTGGEGSRLRQRLFTIPFVARVGLFNRAEAFVGLPLTMAHSEFFEVHLETNGTHRAETPRAETPRAETPRPETHRAKDSGIGDVAAGLKYSVLRETARRPEMVASLSFSAPTGKDVFHSATGVGLGSGQWRLGGGLQFIKSFDPLVLYGGLEYTHQFDQATEFGPISGGHRLNYNFGLGFAVNEHVTLSGQFLGGYEFDRQVGGVDIPDSAREPLAMRLGLTWRISRHQYLEPSVTWGLNASASDAVAAVSYVWRF